VTTVVPEGDCLGERLIETECAGDGNGDLSDLERVSEAGALVVIREDENLSLSGQSAEGGCPVEDSISISLEAGTDRVRLLDDTSFPRTSCERGTVGEMQMFELLPLDPIEHWRGSEWLAGILVSVSCCTGSSMGTHRRSPGASPFAQFVRGGVLDRHAESRAGGCDSVSVTQFEWQLTVVSRSCS
jgi:hypothetical protein